jgi:hypothetical protein
MENKFEEVEIWKKKIVIKRMRTKFERLKKIIGGEIEKYL